MGTIVDIVAADPERRSLHEWTRDHFGRFYLSRSIVETRPDAVLKIMSRVIVTRCEFDFAREGFLYTGISEMFEKVYEGSLVPWYHFNMLWIVNDDGSEDIRLECELGEFNVLTCVTERSEGDGTNS